MKNLNSINKQEILKFLVGGGTAVIVDFFTYKILFFSALKLLISFPALFIFPGITGIIFYIAENYKLINYKLPMEENP